MITYILIGIAFMFSFEYLMDTKSFKRTQIKFNPKLKHINLGIMERIIGVLLWPVWLGVFLYSFCKEYFK